MQSCRRMEFELLLFIFSAARNGILAMENLCNVPIRVIETRSSFFSPLYSIEILLLFETVPTKMDEINLRVIRYISLSKCAS